MTKVEACVVSHTGLVRANNEDNFYLNGIYMQENESDNSVKSTISHVGKEHIFAVCDGMGGQKFGEKASLASVKMLKKLHDKIRENEGHKDIDIIVKWLSSYVLKANEYIFNMSLENGSRMGTTFACLVVYENHAVALNIGDSRVYFVRNGEIRQISTDHTEAQRLIRLGVLTPESARNHKSKHCLSRHFGISPEEGILEADVSEIIDIEQGDIFLICSDGLTDMIDEQGIRKILLGKQECSQLCSALVEEALKKGGVDNITSLLISISAE